MEDGVVGGVHVIVFIESRVESRPNLLQRAMAVAAVLHHHGPSLEAAQALQTLGWFSEVSAEALADKMAESVNKLRSGCIWKFRAAEFGTLEFSNVESQ